MLTTWVKCSERLPESGKPVLAFFKESKTRSTATRAIYAAKHTLSCSDFGDFEEGADYCEARDEYYWPEGWYEYVTQEGSMSMAICGDVTHWMPLPQPPRSEK